MEKVDELGNLRERQLENLRNRCENPRTTPRKTMDELVREQRARLEADVQKLRDKYGVTPKPVVSNLREELIERLRNRIKNPPIGPPKTMDDLVRDLREKGEKELYELRAKYAPQLNKKE